MTRILVPRASRRAQRARPGRRRPPRRRAAHGPRRRRRERRRAAPTRSRAALGGEPEIEVAWDVRYRGQSHELTVRGAAARRAARALRGAARGALRLPRPRRRGRARDRPRHRRGCPARRSTSARPPASEVAGPDRRRAARGDARRARGLEREHRRHRHAGAGARVSVDPIALQVTTGALRAACEEMGAVLVRSAHSANIKERRDCSTALFDAARRDGHAGRAHPGAPRRDARRRRRRARPRPRRRASRGSSTTPTPAARTCPTSRSSRPPSTTASCSASPPRAPTTPTSAGACRARCRPTRRRSTRRASSSRRACSTTPRSTSSPSRCASPRSGAPTCAPSSPPTAPARGACGELADARRPRLPARGDRRRARLRRAAHARVPGGRSTTARATAVDVLEARRRRPRAAACAATVDGDELTLDFTGSRRAARGQPQLPAGGHARAPACSPCACSPTPTSRPARAPTGRSPSIAPEGSLLNARSPAAVAGGNVETSLARGRPRARAPSAARSARGR